MMIMSILYEVSTTLIMKEIHFQNLLRIPGNTSLEILTFEKFSEETDLTDKVERAKV